MFYCLLSDGQIGSYSKKDKEWFSSKNCVASGEETQTNQAVNLIGSIHRTGGEILPSTTASPVMFHCFTLDICWLICPEYMYLEIFGITQRIFELPVLLQSMTGCSSCVHERYLFDSISNERICCVTLPFSILYLTPPFAALS